MIPQLVLDAEQLSDWQECRRRAILNADWRVLQWRPKSLLDALLRKGIRQLSTPLVPDVDSVVVSLKAEYMQVAANPGLDTTYAPYQVAKDYCATLETVLRGVARTPLAVVHDVPSVRLSSRLSWRVSSAADESGTLHRWITVDRWNADRLVREMHGWRIFGDIAVTGMPLQLHVIVIGSEREGRRSAAWNRAWQHPGLPRLDLRFKRKDGKGFQGWKPVYLADEPRADTDAWVDRMFSEGAAQELIQQVAINPPSESVCQDTRAQIMQEGMRMLSALEDRGALTWAGWPMSREACDWPLPCPFQHLCYSESYVNPGITGLYQSRNARPELEYVRTTRT